MPCIQKGLITMNESDIRKYASLMKDLGLTALEISEGNQKIRLECGSSVHDSHIESLPVSKVTEGTDNRETVSGDTAVKSPLVGVFYQAPAENAEPFVSVGKSIKKGDVICIIEAMKLMNEITATEDGIITEILVKNGQVVEFGTELFRLRRQS